MRGICVIHGDGFSKDFPAFAVGSGKVMWLEDLPDFLIDFFDLPMAAAQQSVMMLREDAPNYTD